MSIPELEDHWRMMEQAREDVMRWGPLPDHLLRQPLDHDAIMLWYQARMLEDAGLKP